MLVMITRLGNQTQVSRGKGTRYDIVISDEIKNTTILLKLSDFILMY